jgi:1-acyl-sn-glycerol-3-phosphate acyltransferase
MEPWKLEPAKDLGLTLAKRLRSPWRESGLLQSFGHWLWALAIRLYLYVWHRLRIVGREHLPAAPPFILVANHASHLDALVLASPLPLNMRDRVFALAAGDVFFEAHHLAAFAATLVNAIPLWRRKSTPKALADLRERMLKEPCAFILFPEGKRTRHGGLNPFKSGLGMLIAGTSVPVVPCYVEGTLEALPPGCRLPRYRRIILRIGTPLSFADLPCDRCSWDRIAAAVKTAVIQLGGNAAVGRPGTE